MRKLALWWILTIALQPLLGGAAEVVGLFTARVPVADQEETIRHAAFGQALEQVLIKVTGQRGIAAEAAIAPLRAGVMDLVQNYGYEAVASLADGAMGVAAYDLWVQFDTEALRQALATAGLPFWGTQRPAVLVWLAIDSQNQRTVLAAETAGEERTALDQVAANRGLPLLLPLWDLEDRRRVDFVDLSGGFMKPLREAGVRYGADALLAVHARRDDNGPWRLHWHLEQGDVQRQWEQRGTNLPYLLRAGAHEAIDHLAAQLAMSAAVTKGSGILVTIDGVGDLARWLQVEQTLAELNALSALRPYRIEATRVTFWIDVSGGAGQLVRLLAASGRLEALTPPATLGETGTLQYRLMP